MKTKPRQTVILATVLGIVGFCFLFKWIDKADGYWEAHEVLSIGIRDGDTKLLKSMFRDPMSRDEGISINERLNDDRTWLMEATNTGRAEVVKVLLDAGADVNMRDQNGRTALKIAKQKGLSDIIQMLEAAGAKK